MSKKKTSERKMKIKILLFMIFILLINNSTALEDLQQTTYDLSDIQTIGKMHVLTKEKIDAWNNKTQYWNLNFVIIPKEAHNLEINSTTNISYNRYKKEDNLKLQQDISWCSPIDREKIILKENQEVILFNTFGMEEKTIIINLEYDLPLKTKKAQIFNNWAGFLTNNSNISVILPEETFPWYWSEGFIDRQTNEEGQLVLKWENTGEKLSMTFGTSSEYSIHENQKNNIFNNFTQLLILGIAVALTQIFKVNIKRADLKRIKKVTLLFIYFLLIIYVLYSILAFSQTIEPFKNQLIKSLFIWTLITLVAFILTPYVIKNVNSKAKKGKIPPKSK